MTAFSSSKSASECFWCSAGPPVRELRGNAGLCGVSGGCAGAEGVVACVQAVDDVVEKVDVAVRVGGGEAVVDAGAGLACVLDGLRVEVCLVGECFPAL